MFVNRLATNLLRTRHRHASKRERMRDCSILSDQNFIRCGLSPSRSVKRLER